MAIYFDGATRLVGTPAMRTWFPISLACWVKPANFTANQMVFTNSGEQSTNLHGFELGYNTSGQAFTNTFNSTSATATTTATMTVDTWHHIAFAQSGNTSRIIYLDGSNKVTNTTFKSPNSSYVERMCVGDRNPTLFNAYMTGSVAELAGWHVALSDDDVAALGAGVPAFLVRPDQLGFYCPGVRGLQVISDSANIGTLSVDTGSITYTDHPPVHYPPVLAVNSAGSGGGGGGGTVPPIAMSHFRRRR
jgi:hypothetical protein